MQIETEYEEMEKWMRNMESEDRIATVRHAKLFLKKLQELSPKLKTVNAAETLDELDGRYYTGNLAEALGAIESRNKDIPQDVVRDFALAIHDYYSMRSKWSEIVELGKLGLEACRQIGDSESMGIAYPELCNNLGVSNRMIGKQAEAMFFYKEALDKAIRNEEKSDALTNMCDIYRLQGDTEKAFECGRKAVEFAKQIPDLDRQAKGLEFIALTHVRNKAFEEGIKCYEKALYLRQTTENLPEKARVLCFLADALRDLGTSSSLEQAIVYYKQAIEIENKLKNYLGLGRIYLGMGYAYQKQKKYPEARNKLEQAFDENEDIRFWRGAAICKAILVRNYIELGDSDEALNSTNYVRDKMEHLTSVDRSNCLHGLSGMLLKLAEHLQQSGDPEKAQKFTRCAIEFAEATKDNESLQQARELLEEFKA